MSKDPQPRAGRADILAAALREFADHGFQGASTVRIARAAGVTQPLVHHHFGNKQGLWKEVLAELFGELEGVLATAIREVEGLDRRARVAQLLRSLVRFAGRRPELGRLMLLEAGAGGEAFEELYTRWVSRLVAFYERELDAAVTDGTFRAVDAKLVYLLVTGACVQPFTEPQVVRRAFGLDMRRPEEIERYADLAVDVLLRGLGP